ncbi:hypothetical protein GQX74_004549 [Glossina fuscipes]|nr:hypothetical protein GQX74_004549 [Glossina fuscipes]
MQKCFKTSSISDLKIRPIAETKRVTRHNFIAFLCYLLLRMVLKPKDTRTSTRTKRTFDSYSNSHNDIDVHLSDYWNIVTITHIGQNHPILSDNFLESGSSGLDLFEDGEIIDWGSSGVLPLLEDTGDLADVNLWNTTLYEFDESEVKRKNEEEEGKEEEEEEAEEESSNRRRKEMLCITNPQ